MRKALHLPIAMFLVQAVVSGQTLLPAPKKTAQHLTIATGASATTVAPGGKVSVFVDVTPKAGIHVYAPGAKDYLPIAVALELPAGISTGATKYPKSDTIVFDDRPVPVFSKPFRLVREVTIAPTAKAGTRIALSGVVDYQACDDTICYKPATVPVAWAFTVR